MIPATPRVGGGARTGRRPFPRAVLTLLAMLPVRLHAFTRDARGGASVECALGALVLVSISALCFDLYSRVEADTAVARMAVTMADYVSRDADPDGDEMNALGNYLYEHELGVPANLVYVVTALHQPPGDPRPEVVVLWSDDTVRVGDSEATDALAGTCARYVAEGGVADLPDDFTMADDEVLVIAEVCAGLTREGFLTGWFIAGDLYRLHALPARDPDRRPSPPVHGGRAATYATAATGPAHHRGTGTAARPRTSTAGTAAST